MRAMKNATWLAVTSAVIVVAGMVHNVEASFCGASSYSCCPTEACASTGNYCDAKDNCTTNYKIVKEIVWDKKQVTTCKTVYDRVCEQVPVCGYKTVVETRYRDVNYTTCKPVYKTNYRTVNYTTCNIAQ